MTNEELVKAIQAGAADAADYLWQLYRQNIGFIQVIANKYKAYAENDDLMQEGYFGLYEAVKRYDAGHDVKFMTYAKYWIDQAMRRYVVRCGHLVRLPEHTVEQIIDYKQIITAYEQVYGGKPHRSLIMRCMRVDEESFKRIEKAARMVELQSLNEPLKDVEDGTLEDVIADKDAPFEGILDDMMQLQLKEELWSLVDTLEGRQPGVIRKRYQDNMTLEQISKDYNVTRELIRQTEVKALRTLSRPKYSRRLLPYLTEDQEVSAFRGCGVNRFNSTWTSSTERAAMMHE